ncbi:MAG TPA: serine/threonine-protein kinase [Tepidisphaeraceae bacterium]|jgi:hypothetical protein|nr:serine/threonine-protein kinase [Tepidisphaeraceae bacterium]
MSPLRPKIDEGADATVGPELSREAEDPRLVSAVREYMALLEAGVRPSRQEFISRFPEIAEELSTCLDGLAFVHSAAAQMQGPATAQADDESATARPLGDFKLLREIGRGGMGVVYEAVQLSLGRRVAVKVLPFAATLDARHLQRFRNEAQAAAQLHHTNIVPVYAVGCERSVHYYAMQFIEGQSLAEVIREMRSVVKRTSSPSTQARTPSLGSAPTEPVLSEIEKREHVLRLRRSAEESTPIPAENLSLLRTSKRSAFFRTAARLGLQAAEALDYAHHQGVVHRDVKPENLLLDAKGNLWVTDFGLAQFYEEEGNLTRTGDLLGTLRYMSPEQASGRAAVLDQRTDVYSLGLTIYELLTLERAIPGDSREQLLRQITDHEPKSPRAIDKAIPTELETILSKATAKEPTERYQTARALAEDLRRFLQDEPIQARPPTLWDKSVKWTRRHKSLAASALAMLLLIAIGSLISTLLIAREQGKTKTAYQGERQKAKEAEEQRIRAEKSSKQARDAVGFFSRIAADEMDKPEMANVRKMMLEASLAYYQAFLEERKDDPTIGAELDAARSRVSTILAELSAFDAFFRVQFQLRLLSEESVREDLKLSTEQASKVREMGEPFGRPGGPGGDFQELRQMTTEQKRERFSKLAGEIEHGMAAALTPAQLTRLQQVYRQIRGPLAFSDPDVVEALALTPAQKDHIRLVQSEYRDARFQRGSFGGPPGSERVQKDWVANILTELSADQTMTWKSLTGEPFVGKLRDQRPGPPRRGPGPEPR